jgi:hypothetical protein
VGSAPRPEEIARISAALVSALADAQAMAHAGDVGPEFANLMTHVRDMYELLDEALREAGEAVPEEASAVAQKLGAAIDQMELLLHPSGPTH